MNYEFLNQENKREILKNKLTALESQHYELSQMHKALSEQNGVVETDAKATILRQISETETMHEGLMKEYKAL